MFLVRETDRSVTDVCLDVGFTSLGTCSRTFREIVGETPSACRDGHAPIVAPHCFQMAATRPAGRGGSDGPAIEQFWISHGRGRSLALDRRHHREGEGPMIAKLNVVALRGLHR